MPNSTTQFNNNSPLSSWLKQPPKIKWHLQASLEPQMLFIFSSIKLYFLCLLAGITSAVFFATSCCWAIFAITLKRVNLKPITVVIILSYCSGFIMLVPISSGMVDSELGHFSLQ